MEINLIPLYSKSLLNIAYPRHAARYLLDFVGFCFMAMFVWWRSLGAWHHPRRCHLLRHTWYPNRVLISVYSSLTKHKNNEEPWPCVYMKPRLNIVCRSKRLIENRNGLLLLWRGNILTKRKCVRLSEESQMQLTPWTAEESNYPQPCCVWRPQHLWN